MKDSAMDYNSVDPDVLDTIRSLDQPGKPSVLDSIIELYCDSSAPQVKELIIAAENENDDGFRAIAHSLKSGSANLGALNLAKLCKQAETAADMDDVEAKAELARKIAQEHLKVMNELRRVSYGDDYAGTA